MLKLKVREVVKKNLFADMLAWGANTCPKKSRKVGVFVKRTIKDDEHSNSIKKIVCMKDLIYNPLTNI